MWIATLTYSHRLFLEINHQNYLIRSIQDLTHGPVLILIREGDAIKAKETKVTKTSWKWNKI